MGGAYRGSRQTITYAVFGLGVLVGVISQPSRLSIGRSALGPGGWGPGSVAAGLGGLLAF